jgi:hypothetical protein
VCGRAAGVNGGTPTPGIGTAISNEGQLICITQPGEYAELRARDSGTAAF